MLLDKNAGKLCTSYIGDSHFLVARKKDETYSIYRKSQEKMHDFLSPYQVGTGGDDPSQAIAETIDLQISDIIVLASDGYLLVNLAFGIMSKILVFWKFWINTITAVLRI
jgi:hypothetical protein